MPQSHEFTRLFVLVSLQETTLAFVHPLNSVVARPDGYSVSLISRLSPYPPKYFDTGGSRHYGFSVWIPYGCSIDCVYQGDLQVRSEDDGCFLELLGIRKALTGFAMASS